MIMSPQVSLATIWTGEVALLKAKRKLFWFVSRINTGKRPCVHEWSSSWLVAQPEASRLGVTSVNSLLSHGPLSPQLKHRCWKAIANRFSTRFCWVAVSWMSDNLCLDCLAQLEFT